MYLRHLKILPALKVVHRLGNQLTHSFPTEGDWCVDGVYSLGCFYLDRHIDVQPGSQSNPPRAWGEEGYATTTRGQRFGSYVHSGLRAIKKALPLEAAQEPMQQWQCFIFPTVFRTRSVEFSYSWVQPLTSSSPHFSHSLRSVANNFFCRP